MALWAEGLAVPEQAVPRRVRDRTPLSQRFAARFEGGAGPPFVSLSVPREKNEGERSAGEGASRTVATARVARPVKSVPHVPGRTCTHPGWDALAPLARVRCASRRSVRRFLAGATLPGEIERVALNHGPHFLYSELLADRS
jgi:hypothetical protein